MTELCSPIAGAGELALRAHGMTGPQLLRMAYAVANTYARRTGSGLDSRIDDLAQHLALTATRRAILYDPQKNPNSTFASYLWDIMEPACIDWHRRKAEGFGDRRYGHNNRVTLTDQIEQHGNTDPGMSADDEHVDVGWRRTAQLIQQPFHTWPKVHERRIIRWQHAADTAGWTLDEFIAIAADTYAKHLLREAA